MLSWFQELAPIRIKFRVLALMQIGLALASSLTMALVVEGVVTSHGATLLIVCCSAASVAMILFAGKAICDPYVATVMRMEALRDGDLDAPVAFTHYQDCVGRLARAMTTFRQQAVDLRHFSGAQQQVVTVMSDSLQRLAANDLTTRMNQDLPADYAVLRENFNRAAAALEEALAGVAAAAGGILDGASEIRAASSDLSGRTEQQAAALEQSSASIAEVTGAVQRNAAAAQSVAQAVRDVQTEARHGGEVVTRAVSAMTAIRGSSDQIAQIIAVIDGIAFQTNLLALNAGVEAARAGESGKGFAVVANEVRALAQRSADASTQIRDLIRASTEQVQDGVTLVGETGEALLAIVERIDQIAAAVSEIAESAAHQSASLDDVSAAARNMDRMTQQNAAMVEQSNAAARQLADQSSQLSALVGRFRLARAPAVQGKPHRTGGRSPASPRVPVAAAAPRRVAAGGGDWAEF